MGGGTWLRGKGMDAQLPLGLVRGMGDLDGRYLFL